MEVKSVETFIEILSARSVILGPPSAPGMSPRMSSTRFLDESGLRALLYDLTTQDEDKDRGPIGYIRCAEAAVEEAERAWKYIAKHQRPPWKEPKGQFAEDLNRAKAKLEVYRMEAAKITDFLAAVDEKRKIEKEKTRSRIPLRRGGGCTSRDGQVIEVDGHEVRKGKLDTGEPLEKYLERVNQAKREWAHRQQ